MGVISMCSVQGNTSERAHCHIYNAFSNPPKWTTQKRGRACCRRLDLSSENLLHLKNSPKFTKKTVFRSPIVSSSTAPGYEPNGRAAVCWRDCWKPSRELRYEWLHTTWECACVCGCELIPSPPIPISFFEQLNIVSYSSKLAVWLTIACDPHAT